MGIALVSTPEQQAITDTVVPASRPLVFLLSAAALGLRGSIERYVAATT
jgi:hypothetical protein